MITLTTKPIDEDDFTSGGFDIAIENNGVEIIRFVRENISDMISMRGIDESRNAIHGSILRSFRNIGIELNNDEIRPFVDMIIAAKLI